MEKQHKALRKQEILLVEEMEKIQMLTTEHPAFLSEFEELSTHHDSLSVDHERLTYDYLKRKQELKYLRVVHDDLRMEIDSLLAEQISAS